MLSGGLGFKIMQLNLVSGGCKAEEITTCMHGCETVSSCSFCKWWCGVHCRCCVDCTTVCLYEFVFNSRVACASFCMRLRAMVMDCSCMLANQDCKYISAVFAR